MLATSHSQLHTRLPMTAACRECEPAEATRLSFRGAGTVQAETLAHAVSHLQPAGARAPAGGLASTSQVPAKKPPVRKKAAPDEAAPKAVAKPPASSKAAKKLRLELPEPLCGLEVAQEWRQHVLDTVGEANVCVLQLQSIPFAASIIEGLRTSVTELTTGYSSLCKAIKLATSGEGGSSSSSGSWGSEAEWATLLRQTS